MALNEIVYLPNPAGTEARTVGVELTASGGGPTTIYTVPANEVVRVRNFAICLTAIGDGTSEYLSGILKIGTGKFTVSLITANAGTAYTQNFSCEDLGFNGAWLQVADTITFQAIEAGGGTLTSLRASVSVALEDYSS
jgi:hypothetical protein